MCNELNAENTPVLTAIAAANFSTIDQAGINALATMIAPTFKGLCSINEAVGEDKEKLEDQHHLSVHIIIDIENRCYALVRAKGEELEALAQTIQDDKNLSEETIKDHHAELSAELRAFQSVIRKNSSRLLSAIIHAIPAEDAHPVFDAYGTMRENHVRQQMMQGSMGNLINSMMGDLDDDEDDDQSPVDANTDLSTIEKAANSLSH